MDENISPSQNEPVEARGLTRRELLQGALGVAALGVPLAVLEANMTQRADAASTVNNSSASNVSSFLPPARFFPTRRPSHFISVAVEETIRDVKRQIADPELAWLFENCYPNTLDTTVQPREVGGKPDTFVITGDIDAMWLRDSSAQVWPYLPLMRRDARLQRLLQGVLNRQVKCIQLDPYANAFLDPFPSDGGPPAAPQIHERKWEVDSLCYPVRLAYGYWKQGGDTTVFDAEWENAMDIIVRTFREQQRKTGDGPYRWNDMDNSSPANNVPSRPGDFGSPIKPVGMICSRFRPSDDETTYQFLIPSNLFAVVSLRQMAQMLAEIRHQPQKAQQARALAAEVERAINLYAQQKSATQGRVYAYEVDGLGHFSLADDANVPSLLSLPYLGVCAVGDPLYQATRRMVWSHENPWFYEGKYRGTGGPHVGPDMIWPLSVIMYGLTSTSPIEVAECLRTLKETHAGTGFMHESFHKDDPKRYTRSWFAWANTLFGEFVIQTAGRFPQVLA